MMSTFSTGTWICDQSAVTPQARVNECSCFPQAHLHGHTEALVQGPRAGSLVDLAHAVDETCELAGALVAEIGSQARPGEVQGVDNEQGSGTRKTTCRGNASQLSDINVQPIWLPG